MGGWKGRWDGCVAEGVGEGREGGRVGRGAVVLEYALLRCWIRWLRCR